MEPDVIAVDGGSTDPGPYYLGRGVSFVPEKALERDLSLLLESSIEYGIPLIVGTAGGAGSRIHVDNVLDIVKHIVKEKIHKHIRIGIIYSDVSKEYLTRILKDDRIVKNLSNGFLPDLSSGIVSSSERIVAQIGVEPFMKLLESDVDIIIAGRSVDIAPFAAYPWLKGMDKGLAVHMAKILECGAIAADPGSGSDGMLGILRNSEFEILPLNPRRKATLTSVAEHALYERTDPFHEYIPGGYVDLTLSHYEETGNNSVVVKGSRWIPSSPRLVKLEGVKTVGYRVIFIAGARDPDFISKLDNLLEEAEKNIESLLGIDNYSIHVRVYGKDGVMGKREPTPLPAHEIGLVVEVVASSMDEAKTIAGLYRSTLLHLGWEGRKTTAGNLAFPFSPSDIPVGRVYEWSIWHLVEEKDPYEFSNIIIREY